MYKIIILITILILISYIKILANSSLKQPIDYNYFINIIVIFLINKYEIDFATLLNMIKYEKKCD